MATVFTHKPKKLDKFAITPAHVQEWAAVWAAARAQDWFDDATVGLVGCDATHCYFQKRGVTTGFARLPRPALDRLS